MSSKKGHHSQKESSNHHFSWVSLLELPELPSTITQGFDPPNFPGLPPGPALPEAGEIVKVGRVFFVAF